MTDTKKFHLFNLVSPKDSASFQMIAAYIQQYIKPGDTPSADASITSDDDSHYSRMLAQFKAADQVNSFRAEVCVRNMLTAVEGMKGGADMINKYLDAIANNDDSPDHVVDAVLELQEALVKATPHLREQQAALIADHYIYPKLV